MTLALYAPRLGILSFYSIPQGSCVRSVPIGLQCQLLTVMLDEPGCGRRKACCVVLCGSDKGVGLELSILHPEAVAPQGEGEGGGGGGGVPPLVPQLDLPAAEGLRSPPPGGGLGMRRGQFLHEQTDMAAAKARPGEVLFGVEEKEKAEGAEQSGGEHCDAEEAPAWTEGVEGNQTPPPPRPRPKLTVSVSHVHAGACVAVCC